MKKKPQTILNEMNELLCDEDKKSKVYNFLNKFSQCEVYARYYLEMFYENEKPEDIVLIRDDILSAFNEEGIYFQNEKLLTCIFGQSNKANDRSCKILRNKITHKLNKTHLLEVIHKYDELISKMDEFIQQVEEQS